MAIKFEKIQAGMVLWSRGRQKMGNTTMPRMAEWPVTIKEVYPETRTAMVSWNGNASLTWNEFELSRLYTKRMEKKT